jgi:hypothetical protein
MDVANPIPKTGITQHPRFLALLFSLPFIYGSVVELWRGRHWFDDFEAVSCAGQTLIAKRPLYVSHFSCPNMAPTAYVYPPAIARLLAEVQAYFGLTFEIFAYAGVFCFVVYNVLRLLIKPDSTINARAPFIVEIPGSALPSGNISIVLHGLIFLCGRWFLRTPVLLLPVVVIAAIFKPTFAVYLAVFLFIKRPLPERLALMLIGAAVVAGYFVMFYLTDRGDYVNWQALAHFFGIVAERGNGILGMPGIANISDPVILAGCYGIFAAIILASGLILSEFCIENALDRFMLGISICLLLYPRPMGYDLLTLPFGLGVAVSCFGRIGNFHARHLARILQVICPILMAIGGRAGERMCFELYCVLLVALAVAAVLMTARLGNKLNDRRFIGPITLAKREIEHVTV